MKNLIYGEDFYDSQSKSSKRSALSVVPMLVEMLQPKSVVDIGCGVGTWLSAFREYGVEDVLGIDGEYINRQRLQIPQNCFLSMDLSNPSSIIKKKYDISRNIKKAPNNNLGARKRYVK